MTFWPLAETKMTRCPEEFEIKICDAEFVTSAGDFPQIETPDIDRLTLNEMQREFTEKISAQMADMPENWRVPTERILSWLGEGFHSSQVERIDATTAEICGEVLAGVELEILFLSTGKLSVKEISRRVSKNFSDVLKVLDRPGRRHVIVYSLH